MAELCEPTKSLRRVYGRGSLLSILEVDRILTKVSVLGNGSFALETKNWDSYWQPVHELECGNITESLGDLYSAWRDYIRPGFGTTQRQGFCHRYFRLLDNLLACHPELTTEAWLHALQTTLGFECFGVVAANGDAEVLAAGTCTLRNPCYLLAKLKCPIR